MEGNSTSTGNFGTAAVGAVLSIEMILALIANGIVLLITIVSRAQSIYLMIRMKNLRTEKSTEIIVRIYRQAKPHNNNHS